MNPYDAPKFVPTPVQPPNVERVKATRCVRLSLVILLVPAVYNFICFNLQFNADRVDIIVLNLYRLTNAFGFALIVLGVWLLGLSILELVAKGIHMIFARRSKFESWRRALHLILHRTPYFAIVGALLWITWIAAFYQLGVDFYVISVPIGVASHLLAAGLYLPLFSQWFRLERSSKNTVSG